MTNKNRSPIILYFNTNDNWYSKVIRWAGLSWASHVSVSDGQVVLEITLNAGSVFMADFPYNMLQAHRRQERYLLAYGRPRLTRWTNDPKPNKWRSVLRYLTFGMIKYNDDCMGVAIQILKEAGTDVPSRIVTPGQLRRWVRRKHGRK
jgi:hypothetical protein